MKNNYTEYAFTNRRKIPIPAANGYNVVDRGRIGFSEENIASLRSASNYAYFTSDDPQNLPVMIYVHGTENYDGLRRVHSVIGAREIYIFAPYVAEALSSTDTYRVGFKCPSPCEFGGFNVHLSGASATSENLEIINYAAEGAAFDNKLYSQDMNGIKDINYMFDVPKFLAPNDRLDLTWNNTNLRTWGISLFIRELP